MNALQSVSSVAPAPYGVKSGRRLTHRLRRLEEVSGVVEAVAEAMAAHAFPHRDVFAVRLALEEALVNAIRHGHGGDPTKEAVMRCVVAAEGVVVEVEDQGAGFDPGRVADPLDPANLERPGGRGLLLMRSYMAWVRHSRRGNHVRMGRRRSVA
jgi:serine/threonine-protein kinase RsbW